MSEREEVAPARGRRATIALSEEELADAHLVAGLKGVAVSALLRDEALGEIRLMAEEIRRKVLVA